MPTVSHVAALVVVVLMLAGPVWGQAPPPPAPPPLTQVADTPPQVGASTVIAPPGGLCRELVTQFATVGGPRGDLRNRCTELVGNANGKINTPDVQAGLEQMAGVQGTILGTAKVQSTAAQIANITARLARLRASGTGLGGLALDAPEPLPGPRVASLSGTEIAQAAPSATPSPLAKWGVFLTGTYTWGDVEPTSREAGFDFSGGGVTAGADYRVMPNLILGLALGYGTGSADLSSDGGKTDVNDFAASLYGTYYATDQFFVDGLVTVGWSSYDISRAIRYSIPTVPSVGTGITTVNQTATADTDGFGVGVGVGAGYDFRWGALTAGPIGRVNYLWTKVDGYQESINNTAPGFGLGLDVDSQTVESLVTGLGAQVSYAISTPIGILLPQLRFEWVHEFLNNARAFQSTFVNDPTPSAATTIQWNTDDPDRNYFNVGVGVAATFARGISAFVYYETVLGFEDVTQHRIAGGFRIEF